MNKTIFSLLVTFLAGISTIIGILPTFINKKHINKTINFSLSFSAGIMLTVSYTSLVPESLNYLKDYFNTPVLFVYIFIFIILGIISSKIIEEKIDIKFQNNKLYKLGIISIIILILHNIPEGIITFLTTSNNTRLGLHLALAIALHNIPEGITIAVPIYYATNKRKKALIYTLIAGFSEFIGALFTLFLLKKYLNNFILSAILAMTAGMMLQISFCELIPSALNYNKKSLTMLSFILGILIMIICEYLI